MVPCVLKTRLAAVAFVCAAGTSCASRSKHADQRTAGAHGTVGATSADGTGSIVNSVIGGSPAADAPLVARPSGGIRRLTKLQYANTASDLLGGGITFNGQLDPDVPQLFLNNLGASTVTVTPRGVTLYEQAATDLVKQRFATPELALAFVGCTADIAKGAQDPCAADFVIRIGLKAWRRPLTDVEQNSLLEVYKAVTADSGDPWQGFAATTEAMLASPYFIYRTELGALQPGGALRLDSYEVASRLSYLLWNTSPDSELLAAAKQGRLTSASGIHAEALRMLADPRAKVAIRQFMREWLGFDGLAGLSKNATTFLQSTATLGAAFQGEFDHVVDDLVFDSPGDFTTLLNLRTTFVNSELATFYGFAPLSGADPQAFKAAVLPDTGMRSGLLTMGGLLATQAKPDATAPISRGHYILNRLLCTEIPAPPPGVPALPPEATAAQRTQRQRLGAHTASAGCAACHLAMDGLGLILEHFDGIGAYRDTDRGMKIDATGVMNGQNIDGARQLGSALQSDASVHGCMVRQFYRQALGVQESPGADAQIDALRQTFASNGFKYQELILSIIATDDFTTVGSTR